jgi:hypothetical protein
MTPADGRNIGYGVNALLPHRPADTAMQRDVVAAESFQFV